jgi:amino acid transporter
VRFCDPALGFSLGWIYWLKYAIVTPNQLTAAALLISYWLDAERVNPGVWITVFLLLITTLNYLSHGLASHVEFYVSSFKLLVMFALMILSLVIALGGGPDRDFRGFRYWKDPGAFGNRYDNSLVENFVLTCGTMSSAAFVYIGSERAGIMAQSPNVRKAMSRSIKHAFHLLAIILLGMLVPHDSIALAFYHKATKSAAASPFVAALYLAGMPVVPDILNAFILLFVLSIANYDLWLATKAMCDLAVKRRAPVFLSRVRRGVPVYALAVCASVSTLAYLNVPQDATLMFGYFMDAVTMLGLLTWMSILLTHVSFVRARRAQGIDDYALSFRARFGLPGSWLALALCLFISATMIFGAFSFESGNIKFDYRSVVASYIGVPIYFLLYIGHKVVRKSKRVFPNEADLWTDKQEPLHESEGVVRNN